MNKHILFLSLISILIIGQSCTKKEEVPTPGTYTLFAPNALNTGTFYNNHWYVTGTGISPENFYLEIKNPNYEIIFETTLFDTVNKQSEAWDARSGNGSYCEPGLYYYTVTFQTLAGENGSKNGMIELIR